MTGIATVEVDELLSELLKFRRRRSGDSRAAGDRSSDVREHMKAAAS
jgi:hypothetical protein